MDIDWPPTIGTGVITLVVLVAIALADRIAADGVFGVPAGPAPAIGGLAGIVVGLVLANLLFA